MLADGTHAITGNVSGAGTLDAHLVATGSVTVGGYLGTSGTPLATLSAPAGTLNVGSNWDVTTYTANSGTVAFTGTGTIFTSSAFYNLSKSTGGVTSYSAGIALSVGNNLTVSAGTLVLADIAGTQTVGGNVSGAAGTLDAHLVAGGHVLSVGGYVGTAGTTLANLLAPAGVLNVGGDVDISTSFTSDNGTVELSGATPANVAGLSFYNLIINKAAQAMTGDLHRGADGDQRADADGRDVGGRDAFHTYDCRSVELLGGAVHLHGWNLHDFTQPDCDSRDHHQGDRHRSVLQSDAGQRGEPGRRAAGLQQSDHHCRDAYAGRVRR